VPTRLLMYQYFGFVVIGSGVAGLRYALDVAKYGYVTVITKAEPHESNTNYAQGGVGSVLSPSDSVESHMHDTIVAEAYLCNEETVKVSFKSKKLSISFIYEFCSLV
jgi:L-aspartate oxidase